MEEQQRDERHRLRQGLPDSRSLPVSADWRFLPALPRRGKTLVFDNRGWEPFQGLGMTFATVVIASTSIGADSASVRSGYPANANDKLTLLVASPASPPFSSKALDLVAFPDGFSCVAGRLERKVVLRLLQAARRLLRPGGALYLGFANQWDYRRLLRRGLEQQHFQASLRQMLQLLEKTGFTTPTKYGAFPNHHCPRFLVPLKKKMLIYTLAQHYEGKRSRVLGWGLGRPIISDWLMWMLPAYGLVAKVVEH